MVNIQETLNNEYKQSANQSNYMGTSSNAIQHHYDVGNDFYKLWLDSSLTYSCALWEDDDDLESAQLRKIDFHINQSKASDAKRVLEIGCGWGGTLKRLVEKHNVEYAVGLTLSKAQAEWIESFKQPQIEIKLESWSEYFPQRPFDVIISIGAFEHFAKLGLTQSQKIESYRTFFQRCQEWLKPGGYMSLQTIVYENARREDFNQFIAEEIFPESDLPHLAEIATATKGIFEIITLQNNRHDYVRTLKEWLRKLKVNRREAVNLVGEEVVARYEKYLSLFIIGFHTGTVNLSRIVLRVMPK